MRHPVWSVLSSSLIWRLSVLLDRAKNQQHWQEEYRFKLSELSRKQGIYPDARHVCLWSSYLLALSSASCLLASLWPTWSSLSSQSLQYFTSYHLTGQGVTAPHVSEHLYHIYRSGVIRHTFYLCPSHPDRRKRRIPATHMKTNHPKFIFSNLASLTTFLILFNSFTVQFS